MVSLKFILVTMLSVKNIEDGNIVILKYVVTNKENANGASTFSLSGNIGGFSDVTITTNSNADNGSEV